MVMMPELKQTNGSYKNMGIFVFIGAGVESLAECKIQEKKGQKKFFWFLFGIIMIVAPTIWMVSQIREFLSKRKNEVI